MPSSRCSVVSCGVSMPTRSAGSADVGEGRREALGEPVTALADHLELASAPTARVALEDQHLALGRRALDRVEGVKERRLGELGRLRRGAGRRQPGLGATRQRLLGDDEKRDPFHATQPSR